MAMAHIPVVMTTYLLNGSVRKELFMNKTDVIARVAERSGVPAESCAQVIDALEKVLQDELTAKGTSAFGKISAVLSSLASGKNR